MTGPTMTSLLTSELRKITSTRLWWGLLLAGVAFTALSAGISAGFAGMETTPGQPPTPTLDTPEAIRGVYAVSTFSGMYVPALILGITGMTGEYRYRTITPTFLVSPRRERVVVAKMVAHLALGLLYGVVSLVTAIITGVVVIALRGFDLGFGSDRLWTSAALAVVAVAIWTLIGIGIGTLVRNQVFAILLAIAITFLVEPLLTLALSALDLDRVVAYLPSNASSALMEPSNVMLDYLDWWAGGLVLLSYAAVLTVLGLVLSLRRDVS